MGLELCTPFLDSTCAGPSVVRFSPFLLVFPRLCFRLPGLLSSTFYSFNICPSALCFYFLTHSLSFLFHAHSFFNQQYIISRFTTGEIMVDNVNYTMKFGQRYNINPRFLIHSGQVKLCYLKLFLSVMVYSDSLQLLEYYKISIV